MSDYYSETLEGMQEREYDIQKSEKELGMSSLVVSYNAKSKKAFIGSDSRVTRKNMYYDFYPKLFVIPKGIVGLVGVSGKFDINGIEEFGERILNIKDDVFNSLVSLSAYIMPFIPFERDTVMVALLQNGLSVDWWEFYMTQDTISIRKKPDKNERTIYGVKYAQFTPNIMSIFDRSDTDGIRKIIEIDRQCDSLSRTVATVGGPVQLYEINPYKIYDYSDEDAPKDFNGYYEFVKKSP